MTIGGQGQGIAGRRQEGRGDGEIAGHGHIHLVGGGGHRSRPAAKKPAGARGGRQRDGDPGRVGGIDGIGGDTTRPLHDDVERVGGGPDWHRQEETKEGGQGE